MKSRPILFNGAMVRALLNGSKTQTRRIVKIKPPLCNPPYFATGKVLSDLPTQPGAFMEFRYDKQPSDGASFLINCPHGQPGDRFWVRETFRIGEDLGDDWESWMETGDRFVICDAGHDIGKGSEDYCVPIEYEVPRNAKEIHNSERTPEHWRSFGPIPSIFMPRWASRIQLEIVSVRVERLQDIGETDARAEGVMIEERHTMGYCSGQFLPPSIRAYSELWESINGAGSWAANPWVWVVEFKRI